ncbi:hypothetical protein [Kushneria aurantia]|uniref:Chromosome partition protein Smc n=1 Tax=Kushneria aurantia TaxID=504092 RepID=A0ABV6FYV3_9GAMM|nr:hypothetical protein [Kushneria aurantia]
MTHNSVISQLAQASMFWQPAHAQPGEWLAHLPFLFWLVEAHSPRRVVSLGVVDGTPHFALCQAISRLRLDTLAFAVPGRQPHSERAYEALSSGNAQHYGAFSQLVDSEPVRAAEQFDNDSVDLLLLELTADREDLPYLLERWLPRLSSRAVVLVPQIGRHDPQCRLFRDFNALAGRFRAFQFPHGSGLGVLSVGDNPTPLLESLLSFGESASGQQVVREVFAHLGRALQEGERRRELQHRSEALDVSLREAAERLDTLTQEYQGVQASLAQSREEAADVRQRLEKSVERHATERGQLAERASLLQEWRDELKTETGQWRERFATQQRQLESSEQTLKALRQEQQSQQAAHEKALASLQQSLDDEKQQHQYWRSRADESSRSLEAEAHQRESLDVQNAELAQQLTAAGEAREAAESSLEAAHQRIEEQQGAALEVQKALDERFEELSKLTQMLTEAQEGKAEADASLASAEREVEEAKRQVQEKQRSIDTRFRELAKLTEMLEENEQTRDKLSRQLSESQAREERKVEEQRRARADERARHAKEIDKARADGERRVEEQRRARTAERRRYNTDLAALEQERDRQSSEIVQLVRELENARAPKLLADPMALRPARYRHKSPGRKQARLVKREVEELVASGQFHAEWYLNTYPDVAQSQNFAAAPARHYLLFGGYEGRNPNPEFDSTGYLSLYPDVLFRGMNPLLHYIRFGQREERQTRLS